MERLRAFVGDVLEENERSSVLAHLNQCIHCREILALITPEEAPQRRLHYQVGEVGRLRPILRRGGLRDE